MFSLLYFLIFQLLLFCTAFCKNMIEFVNFVEFVVVNIKEQKGIIVFCHREGW